MISLLALPRGFLLGAWLLVLASPGPARAGDGLRARLARGEIVIKTKKVPGSAVPEAVLTAVVDAPPGRVWDIIQDCGSYHLTMHRVKESRELSRKGDKVVCKVKIDMPMFLPDLEATTEATHTVTASRWRRKWRLLKGNYRRNEGSWTLARFGKDPDRTLVVYRVLAIPDFNVPAAILQVAQERSLPAMIERLREQANKD